MWVLALDTTTRAGSAALVRDDRVVVERPGDPSRTHAERLPQELAAVLAEAGLSAGAVDLLAVASGPGPFTGLRIGLAAIQGLAVALNRRVAAVSALQAHAWLALHARPGAARVGVWLDAQRGEVYAALYGAPPGGDDWPLLEEHAPVAAPPADVLRLWSPGLLPGVPVVGDGARRYAAALAAAGLRPDGDTPALAGAIGRLARRLADAGATGPPHAVMPLYVRRPDAELERERIPRPCGR